MHPILEKIPMRYPRLLSFGSQNKVIALSETEVAKLFTSNSRSEIGSEAEKMQYANTINGLIVRFNRLEFNENLHAGMLVMERIYPLDFRAYEMEKREYWLDNFMAEMAALHHQGFVHRDIKRRSNDGDYAFDNILLTQNGLRLIDVGRSAIKDKVGNAIFDKYVELENANLSHFSSYFLAQ